MSNGNFEVEDQDIVTLKGVGARSGWVNIGTHAVFLELSSSGNLTVSIKARNNEDAPLGEVSVSKEASVAAGASDPDVIPSQFLVAEGWSIDLFVGEKLVRFIFDVNANKIIFMQISYNQKWNASSPEAMADVQDSLVNGNEDAIKNPDDYGLVVTSKLPEWAKINN